MYDIKDYELLSKEWEESDRDKYPTYDLNTLKSYRTGDHSSLTYRTGKTFSSRSMKSYYGEWIDHSGLYIEMYDKKLKLPLVLPEGYDVKYVHELVTMYDYALTKLKSMPKYKAKKSYYLTAKKEIEKTLRFLSGKSADKIEKLDIMRLFNNKEYETHLKIEKTKTNILKVLASTDELSKDDRYFTNAEIVKNLVKKDLVPFSVTKKVTADNKKMQKILFESVYNHERVKQAQAVAKNKETYKQSLKNSKIAKQKAKKEMKAKKKEELKKEKESLTELQF